MPWPQRHALLWLPGLHTAARLTRAAPRSCSCSIPPVVRRAVAGALAGVASTLSPTEVRRLIAVRNWRPEDERTEVDAIVRKARAAGVGCAQWEAGSAETILATAVDGAATQGFLLVSPVGRKKRISSIL